VGGFLIVLIMALVVGQSLVITQNLAHVSALAGDVTVKLPRGGDFHPLADGSNVVTGTQIHTGPTGTATLNWIDGTRIRLGSNAIMTVLQCQINKDTLAETSLFKLDAGEILVRVRRLLSGQSKFEIRTPTATAGVRGTIFTVKVAPDGQTQIAVLEGKVQVDASGRRVALTPGNKLEASAQGAQVQTFSPQEQAAWNGEKPALGPFLTVTSPTADGTVPAGTLQVKGQVEKGAKVTVNGQPAHVTGWNRFSFPLEAKAGEKLTVTIVARDERGYETRVVRELTVGP
jgi:hypothetical protein